MYGLYHRISKKTTSFKLSKNHKLFSRIFYLDILFDFTNNISSEKEYSISYGIKLIKKYLPKINKNNRNYLNIVLKKILNSKYISEKFKYNIKEKFKSILV